MARVSLTHSLPSLLLGVSLGLEGWCPHGTGSPLTLSSTLPALGGSSLEHQGWTGLNRGLADRQAQSQEGGQFGKRRWRRDKGPIVRMQRGLWCSGAFPQPEVLLPWQNQRALLSCSWWGCNWYMFLESCLAASKESLKNVPTLHF